MACRKANESEDEEEGARGVWTSEKVKEDDGVRR